MSTATITIHGELFSVATQRVLVVLAELDVSYAFNIVRWRDPKIKTDEWKNEFHPFGLVPVMDDAGFVLFESRAIAQYLVAKFDPKNTRGLLPLVNDANDVEILKARAMYNQAASIELNMFEPYVMGVCLERLFKPLLGIEGSEQVAAQNLAALEGKLQGYEIILGRQKFLAGDHVTLVDLFHLPFGNLITNTLGVNVLSGAADRKEYKTPNVARWWKDISSRKAWQDVLEKAERARVV